MALADFGEFSGGVTVAGADFTQVFARHAVQSVDGFGLVARGDEQVVKRGPVVSPIEIEADALAEFTFINVAAPPFVENVLVAGENRLTLSTTGRFPASARCSINEAA